MKTYYCFIPTNGMLDAQSKVFKVAVGISNRDQVKRQLVDLYACDCNLFFRVWDDTTEFELKCRMSQSPDASFLFGRGLKVIHVSIYQLYQAIIDGSVSMLDNPAYVNQNYFKLNAMLSPHFFFVNNPNKKVIPRAYSKRKNLSVRPTRDDHIAAIGFALIFLLYWLGSLLELWEASLS